MSRPGVQLPARGFTLIELMVTLVIGAILVTSGISLLGNTLAQARERSVVNKLTQDFSWARTAAIAGDGAAIGATAGVRPTLVLTLGADCTWTTTVNGTTDAAHSYTATQLGQTAAGMTCTATGLTLPATLAFTAQGSIATGGKVTYVGKTTQTFPLQVLTSGFILLTSATAGVQS